VTEWMRSIGATACSLPAHPAWSDWCAEVLNRHFHHRVRRYPPVDWSRISSDYAEIVEADVTDAMVTAWQSEQIPERQRALVQWELAEMYAGRAPLVYSALARALRPYVTEGTGVLEIGCASGYYSEVLEYLLDLRIAYAGVDYSDPLIRMARVIYPRKPFYVGDGASLPFRDRQFRVAVSSCVLLHVPNYREHIAETARVAAGVVVAHRTPVTRHRPTQIFRKLAYGVETVELVFNEDELLGTFEESGLRPVSEFDLSADPAEHSRVVTYVFER
jgi:SAM-dependent methyltransferase